MLYYTLGQWKAFAAMMAAGILAGAWYGLMGMARRVLKAGFWLNAVVDLAAAAGICAVITGGLIVTLYGEIRLFAVLAAGAGFVIERISAGRAANKMIGLALACKDGIMTRMKELSPVNNFFR